jgi:integrase
MLRRLPSNRTILMTLYGTGVRRAELTRLRSATSIADAWSCTFRAAKAGKTDVMLSPVLLEELRAHWLPRPPRQRLPSDGFFGTRRLKPSFSLEHASPRRVRQSTSVTLVFF